MFSGDQGDFTVGDRDTGLFQGITNSLIILRRGGDLEAFRVVGVHVLGPGVNRQLEQLVLVNRALFDRNDALFLEHPADASGFAEAPAMPAEDEPDFGHRPIAIVGKPLDDNRHAAGTVPFVKDGFERCAA